MYPHGHHGNAVMSKFPIVEYQNHDVSIAGPANGAPRSCAPVPAIVVTSPPELARERLAIRSNSVLPPVGGAAGARRG